MSGAAPVRTYSAAFSSALVEQHGIELVVVLDVDLLLAALDFVQRRLRDIDVSALDQQRDLPVEESQQQRADMAAIDVRVSHDDDAVIAQFCRYRIPRARCRSPAR